VTGVEQGLEGPELFVEVARSDGDKPVERNARGGEGGGMELAFGMNPGPESAAVFGVLRRQERGEKSFEGSDGITLDAELVQGSST
jgi:hypothetical protein